MSSHITYKGQALIMQVLKKLNIDRIVITDDTGAIAQTDSLATFATFGTDNVDAVGIMGVVPSGNKLYVTLLIPKSAANFPWTKVGLVDINGNLLAQSDYVYASKTSSTAVQMTVEIG